MCMLQPPGILTGNAAPCKLVNYTSIEIRGWGVYLIHYVCLTMYLDFVWRISPELLHFL